MQDVDSLVVCFTRVNLPTYLFYVIPGLVFQQNDIMLRCWRMYMSNTLAMQLTIL